MRKLAASVTLKTFAYVAEVFQFQKKLYIEGEETEAKENFTLSTIVISYLVPPISPNGSFRLFYRYSNIEPFRWVATGKHLQLGEIPNLNPNAE